MKQENDPLFFEGPYRPAEFAGFNTGHVTWFYRHAQIGSSGGSSWYQYFDDGGQGWDKDRISQFHQAPFIPFQTGNAGNFKPINIT